MRTPAGIGRLTPAFLLLVAIPTTVAAQQLARSARLVGIVRDDQGSPVARARASLSAVGGGAISNDSGRFVFDSVPAGDAVLRVRAIGFAPARATVRLVADSTTTVEIRFTQRLVLLSEVNVRARRFEASMEEFESRRRQGFGHFMSPEDLARRAPNRLSLVVAQLPGTILSCPRGTECSILFSRAGGVPGSGVATANTCSPSVYIDGRLDRTGEAWNLFSDQVSAVEVYTREINRPFEFAQQNNRCGAIAIWRQPLELDPRESTDAILTQQCGGRLKWCYLRQWWPLAAMAAFGLAIAF